MKHAMRKILACVAATAIALGTMSCALAAEYPSAGFQLSGVRSRPTKAPVETEAPAQPEETPAPIESEEPVAPVETEAPAEPIETEAPVETEAPAEPEAPVEPEASAEPEATEEPEQPTYIFQRDENGKLILDKNGNPVVSVPEGMAIPVGYARDENGALVLDENGDPIVTDVLAAEEPEATPEPEETAEPEETEAPKYSFERDEAGNLILDENGNPVAIVPEGAEIPVKFQRDENGNLILDEHGDPVVEQTVPAGSQLIDTEKNELNPDRRIDIYLANSDLIDFGDSVTFVGVLYGYENLTYTLQWQQRDEGGDWYDLPGENEETITIIAAEENLNSRWRICVNIYDAESAD